VSAGKVQNLIDVDESVFATIVVGSDGCVSEIYVAPNSAQDKPKIERLILALDIKYCATTPENDKRLFGIHKWDILEYDNFRFIKIYPCAELDHKMVIVLARCTKDLMSVVDSVIGYMNEDEDVLPINLFDRPR
jgi:hypothetical protein